MKKQIYYLLLFFLVFIFWVSSCTLMDTLPTQEHNDTENALLLKFELILDKDVYTNSIHGEPPQIAIWLEDPTSQVIKTVFVTYRSATGNWIGKVSCPVALPYWFSRYGEETNTQGPPTHKSPAVDAVTGATPKFELIARVEVVPKSRWNYFIEVNVAGDFNADFPSMLEDGSPDPHGNGQPSLIYKGSIVAKLGQKDLPTLVGRTEQWLPTDKIIKEMDSITSAKEILTEIEVACQSR